METFNELVSKVDAFENRKIPGTEYIENRSVLYFQDNCKNPIDKQFFTITNFVNPPTANNGAANLVGCVISLPNRKKFHAILIHGDKEDIKGWEEDIKTASKSMKLSIGYIENGSLFATGDDTFNLKDCDVSFY
ncbi:hypothetical protein [Psychrobacter pygoscelis]|uniref:hypothetical protein n=1 Tax=Psychrobacter pygoscelis TaxID=2488563 RepID=UPI00103B277D|nr:hypothetical protein [Psychrobacter pygoscelis]